MTYRRLIAAFLLSLTLIAAPMSMKVARADDAPKPVTEKDLLDYLDQSIAWYRHVAAAETSNVSSREVLLRNNLQQNALKALRYAFEVARTQGDVLQQRIDAAHAAAAQKEQDAAKAKSDAGGSAKDDDGEQKFNPAQAKINIDAKIADLQKQISDTGTVLTHASRAKRVDLLAQRDKLNAELNLAKTQGTLIDTVLQMSTSERLETIPGQIDNLAKAIPELTTTTAKKKTDATTEASSDVPNPLQLLVPGLPSMSSDSDVPTAATSASDDNTALESKGVIGLIGELVTRSRQRQDLSDLQDETASLQSANDAKIADQRSVLLGIIKRSKDLSQKTESATATELVEQGQELTQLNEDFKTVSDNLVPLSKQRMALRNSAQILKNWQSLFTDEMSQTARRLFTRVLTLFVMLAVPFLLSELVRRGLSQYIHDSRRRRQFNIIRRIVVGLIVGLIVLLNLTSEFGSMATFIGFVTAGLAVALQNVILSVVAYFFFFGRFGLKVGSRISVYGVTGDVIETGFVRLYVMELAEEKGQMRPTGRIVAFPNSILFQPTAFFKQVPGVNYRWHEMTYTLEPDTERALAETKLREIVESVYKDNKSMIDMQKAALEQQTRLRVKEPRPEGRIEKTSEGLNMIVRYPVDTEQAETTDKNVQRQVGEIFERLPAVKRISDEPPAIKRK